MTGRGVESKKKQRIYVTRQMIAKNFERSLGEKQEETVLEEYEREYYEIMKEIVSPLTQEEDNIGKIKGELDTIYRIEIKRGEKKQMYLTDAEERIVIEISKKNRSEEINELVKQMREENIVMGFYITVQKRGNKIYMIFRDDTYEGYSYIIYDGENEYKYKIREISTGIENQIKEEQKKAMKEIRREMKEKSIDRKELMTKEKLEKWISEGYTYNEIGAKVGVIGTTVKGYCEKFGIDRTIYTKRVNERKQIPEEYLEKRNDIEAMRRKQEECKRGIVEIVEKVKREGKYPEIVEGVQGVYGIFNNKTNECIYVGSTEDIVRRILKHKEKYDKGYKQHLFEVIHEKGGWDNHYFALLEERESHIGLNYIESIWWEALKPVGNKVNPMVH
jgi:hypothetical protein